MGRSKRGVVAGVGSGSSLLAAVACTFIIASAVVAFEAWPGGSVGGAGDSSVRIPQTSARTTAVDAIGAAAADAAGAVDASPSATAVAATAAQDAAAIGDDAAASADPVLADAGVNGGPGGGTTAAGGNSAASSGDSDLAATSEDGPGDPIAALTSEVGQVPVAVPGVAGAVTEAGRALGDAVGTYNAPLGDAVTGAAGRTGAEVGDLKQPLDDILDIIPKK